MAESLDDRLAFEMTDIIPEHRKSAASVTVDLAGNKTPALQAPGLEKQFTCTSLQGGRGVADCSVLGAAGLAFCILCAWASTAATLNIVSSALAS
jgi:hypothetical protein